jgi:hypothetical protein
MLFDRIVSEGLAHYSYLIGDENEALAIDPRRDVGVYVEKASNAGMRIAHILETHRNEDYFVGWMELAEKKGAEVWHADSQGTTGMAILCSGPKMEGGQARRLFHKSPQRRSLSSDSDHLLPSLSASQRRKDLMSQENLTRSNHLDLIKSPEIARVRDREISGLDPGNTKKMETGLHMLNPIGTITLSMT